MDNNEVVTVLKIIQGLRLSHYLRNMLILTHFQSQTSVL